MISYIMRDKKRFLTNKIIFIRKKRVEIKQARKFYWLKFLNNEVNFGKKLTRDANALCTLNLFSGLDTKKKKITSSAFFFNPKFKFGFVLTQVTNSVAEAAQVPSGEKFKIGVRARASSFLEEQSNNYFLHYTLRNAAFSKFNERCIKIGAQFSPVLKTFSNAASTINNGKSFLSYNAAELGNFYYKKLLSIRNQRSNVFKTLVKKKKVFYRSPFFWNKQRFGRLLPQFRALDILKRIFVWYALRHMSRPSLFKKRVNLRKKKMLLRVIFQRIMTRYIKMKRHFWPRRKGYPIRKNRNGAPVPDYVYKARNNYFRKKRVVGSLAYSKLRIFRADRFSTLFLLKKSLKVLGKRFKKKRRRRVFIRNARKAVSLDV